MASMLAENAFLSDNDVGQALVQIVRMSDPATSWMPQCTFPP